MGIINLFRMKYAAAFLATAAAQTYTESDITAFFTSIAGETEWATIVNYLDDDIDLADFTYDAADDDGVFTSADDGNAGTLAYEWDIKDEQAAVLRFGSADSDLALTCTAATGSKGTTLTYVAYLSTFLDADYSDYRSACAFMAPEDTEAEETFVITMAATSTSGSSSVDVTLTVVEDDADWFWVVLESILGLAFLAALAVFLF